MFSLVLALLAQTASAQGTRAPDVAPMTAAELQAEYHRVSDELHNYARRQSWNAVEQAYLKCVATGAPMKASDHFHAAHAARARGEMKAVRERLLLALGFGADRDVIDWLWAIDQTYSPVTIVSVPAAELIPEERPFDPVQNASIDFAIATLAATGRFEGLLPRGRYLAAGQPFELRMGKGHLEVQALPQGGKRSRKKDRG